MGVEKPHEEEWNYITPNESKVLKIKAGFIATIDTNFMENYVKDFMEILEESV